MVATLAAVLLGVMVGVGIGQDTVIHGGSPSDVYILREPTQEGCVPDRVNTDGVSVMPLQFTLTAPSHVLVSFSFEVAGIDPRDQVQVNPQLDGSGDDFAWLFVGNSRETVPGSVTSVFPDQETGMHTVDIYAAVAGRRTRGPSARRKPGELRPLGIRHPGGVGEYLPASSERLEH